MSKSPFALDSMEYVWGIKSNPSYLGRLVQYNKLERGKSFFLFIKEMVEGTRIVQPRE